MMVTVTTAGSEEPHQDSGMGQPGLNRKPRKRTNSPRLFLSLFAVYVAMAALWLGLAAWTAFHGGSASPHGQVAPAANGFRAAASLVSQFLFSAVNLAVGLFVVTRFVREWTARFLAIGMVGTAVAYNGKAADVVARMSGTNGGLLALGQEAFVAVAAGCYVLGLAGLVLSRSRKRISIKNSSGRRLGWILAGAMGVVALGTVGAGASGMGAPILGASLLVSGMILQGYHALRSGASPREWLSARLFMVVLVAAFGFAVLGMLAFLWLDHQKLSIEKLLDAHFALLVLAPLLTGLPVALFFGVRKGIDKLVSALGNLLISGLLTVITVAFHIGIELAIKRRTATALKIRPESLLATGLSTLIIVAVCDRLRGASSRRLHDWIYGGKLRRWVHDERLGRESLLRFSKALVRASDPAALLDIVVRQAERVTGAVAARASMRTPGGSICRWSATGGEEALRVRIPLRNAKMQLGEIGVSDRFGRKPIPGWRSRRRPISYSSNLKLRDLAAVAALAIETHLEREATDPEELDFCHPRRSRLQAASSRLPTKPNRLALARAAAS